MASMAADQKKNYLTCRGRCRQVSQNFSAGVPAGVRRCHIFFRQVSAGNSVGRCQAIIYRHTQTPTHTHFGNKQSTEKAGLDVLDLVRCKAEQKQ